MPILSITTGIPNGRDKYDDYVYRHQVEAFNRTYEDTKFIFTDIDVEAGPKDGTSGRRQKVTVKLRYAIDSTFLFATYGDNPKLHHLDRDEWESAARNALEKFIAGRGLSLKAGPNPEYHNRYNLGVELNQRIEVSPGTLEHEKQVAEARKQLAAEEDERRRIRRLLGVSGAQT